MWVGIDPKDAVRPALFHLERIKTGVAAYLKNTLTLQILWNRPAEPIPFYLWIIAQRMVRSCFYISYLEILEPLTQRLHLPLDCLPIAHKKNGSNGSDD
jgi:hypothetical protein